jgi:hypothetical protein
VRRLAAFALAGAALVAVPPAASATPAATPKALASAASPSDRGGTLPIIRGRVGPGFEITVSRHRAAPRRYTLIVRDRSPRHNWHIRGPGVDRTTGVPFVGRREWTVRLREGTYRIVCDPHSSTMRTRIVVG